MLAGCAVPDTHEQTFDADVFVQIIPMDADAAAAQGVVFQLGNGRREKARKVSQRDAKFFWSAKSARRSVATSRS
jgi:hypothetical protein